MASHISEDSRTLYLSARHGWSEQAHPDARYRLLTVLKTLHQSEITNRLDRPNSRGGWDEVSPDEEGRLAGAERGWSFTVKARADGAHAFMEVRSMRFIDREMGRELLSGLHLHDESLAPYEDLNALSDVFAIPMSEAESFVQRVKSRGGLISEAQADLQGMYANLTGLSEIHAAIEKLCTQSRAVIDRIAEGTPVDAPSISQRSKEAHALRQQATGRLSDVRDEQLTLERQPGLIEEKGWAKACLEKSEEWMDAIERGFKEHKSYELQAMARVSESMSNRLPSPDSPAAERRLLFLPVVEWYVDRGFDARLTDEGGMDIYLAAGNVISLTDRPAIKTGEAVIKGENTTEGGNQRENREL